MPPPCIQRIDHPRIKLGGERTSVFYFLNPAHRAVLRCELDGCEHPEGGICDWLVKADDVTPCLHLFVELKGHDYRAAITQLSNALDTYPVATRDAAARRSTRCYIVGTGFPAFRTQGQKAADLLERRYGVRLLTRRDGDREPL